MTREVATGSAAIDQFPAFEDNGVAKRTGLLPGDFAPTVFRDGAVVVLPVTITEIAATGEYRTSFTPDANGFYELHVLIVFNGETRFARYVSVTELTHDLAEDARERTKRIDEAAVTLPPAENSLVDHLTNKDASNGYNPATDSLEALADALSTLNTGTATSLAQIQADLQRVLGLLHKNSMLDNQIYDGQGQLTSARLRVFDTASNVPASPEGSETAGLLHEYNIDAEYAGLNVVTKFTLKQVL